MSINKKTDVKMNKLSVQDILIANNMFQYVPVMDIHHHYINILLNQFNNHETINFGSSITHEYFK